MLADVNGDLLSLMMVGVHEDPLDQVVTILIASNVDERNAGTVWTSGGNDTKVAIQKVKTTDLEAFLDDLGGKLIDAVAVRVGKNVVDDPSFVRRRTVLAEMLDAPIAKLTMSNEINIADDFLNGRPLLLLDAVLEDVLHDQASGLTKCNLMPHATKRFVDLEHDLRWLAAPSELKQLLPDMTSITMDDGVRDPAKKFPNHVSFVAFWNRVEAFLDDVAAKRVHAKSNHIATNSVCDSNDLVWCAMLEATLYKEVAEAVDHQRVCLIDDRLNNFELLLSCANLELLLQED